MAGPILTALLATLVVFFALAFAAWRRYLWAAEPEQRVQDTCPYSLTEVFSDGYLLRVPHQKGVEWLSDVFARSAERFPKETALQIPHTGELLTFAELDARAEAVAEALSPYLDGPDQVVTVAMAQDNWQIVAAHLGILRAGGTVMFLDTALPEALVAHMLEDAQPVVVLTRGQERFRDLPTVDLLSLPEEAIPKRRRRERAPWLDDPEQRLAALFYTSGTTGLPKGVECPHAGYVNLALSYADYFDLVPGVDATTLTSSLGYDGSISEMYSAWVAGCAVVLLTKEEVRSGPDLLGVLREAEVTVLFCPPVLLTTLTPNPELDLPYPLCRYVVPAGEAFPPALVEPWTRARRQIINTYGPTEASTDTSRQSLQPGEPVTIGSPLANVTYVILEVGGLAPLPHGEVGELCIGGVHVGRGYRNQPERTAEKFITHPQFGRLFRTGDRCEIDPGTHRVQFLGRIDTQLKVRGHRVEIQPVEDMLQAEFEEVEAAVLDYQEEELVAFVAAPSLGGGEIQGAAPAPREWAERVTESLSQRLPEPSVPTRIFLVEEFEMKPVSGKIDRDRLPDLSRLSDAERLGNGKVSVAPREPGPAPNGVHTDSEADPAASEVLAICREVFDSFLGWDDAFADHGGHSIVIARLAQRLRVAGWAVSVRALLTDCDTARKVARGPRVAARTSREPRAASSEAPGGRDEAAAEVLSVASFTARQISFLLLLYSPAVIGLAALVALAEIGDLFLAARIQDFVGAGLLVFASALLFPFACLLWVLLIKRLIRGDRSSYTPGAYPKWSRMHLRIWCIGRLERTVLWPVRRMYRSAPLMAFMLRRLGATVGQNLQCAHDAEFSSPLDLLTVGDDVAIQTGAYIHLWRWVGQEMHVGPVHLESGCKIGMRAGVASGVRIGRRSWITPFTPVLETVGPDEMWEGAPARLAGRRTNLERTQKRCRYRSPAWIQEALNLLLQISLECLLLVVPTALVTWWTVTLIPARRGEQAVDYFETTPLLEIVGQMGLYALVTSWVVIVLTSVLSCLFLRCTRASAGIYPVRGLRAALLLYRMKKLNQVQQLWTWTVTGQYLRALAGLRFTRLGASECDLMFNLVPELGHADAQVFWSHGCFTNMLDHGADHLQLSQLDMPANFFASNNCVAESGRFPTNFLLGVSTPASEVRFRRQMHSRFGEPITVAGNPPVRFGSADFEAEDEARALPSLSLFLGRLSLNDLFGVGLLPIAEALVYVVLYTLLLRLGGHPIASALLALVLVEVTLVVACVLIKKVLVGREWGSDHSTPFWSWRHFTYFFVQDCFFAWCRRPLAILDGTVLANFVLRRMGCRIGKRNLVTSSLQVADWNAVSFGDDCVVSGFLQFHTFEDMTLKVKLAEIRDGSSVNFGATVMGGAVLEPETTLLPLSMVLKEMYLPTDVYEGSPAEPRSDAGG